MDKHCENCKYWKFLWISMDGKKKREGGCSVNRVVTTDEGWCAEHKMRPKRITVKEIKKNIKEIDEIKNQDDDAHSKEDYLHLEVLVDIARGVDDPQKLAKETIKTQDIRFARWVG